MTKAYALRLPDDLHAALVEAAETSHRSLNAEIVHRLSSGSAPERQRIIAEPRASERGDLGASEVTTRFKK